MAKPPMKKAGAIQDASTVPIFVPNDVLPHSCHYLQLTKLRQHHQMLNGFDLLNLARID